MYTTNLRTRVSRSVHRQPRKHILQNWSRSTHKMKIPLHHKHVIDVSMSPLCSCHPDTEKRNDSTSPRTLLSIRQRTSTKKIRLRESTYVHVRPTTYINDEVTTPRVHVRPCRLDNARQQRINDLASPPLSWPREKRARSAPTHQQTGEG